MSYKAINLGYVEIFTESAPTILFFFIEVALTILLFFIEVALTILLSFDVVNCCFLTVAEVEKMQISCFRRSNTFGTITWLPPI